MPPKKRALDFRPKAPPIRLDNTDTKRQHAGFSTSKIIRCGSLIETYEYQYPVRFGFKAPSVSRKPRKKSERTEEYRGKTIIRAINRIRQLAYLNFSENDKFITLTFNNEQKFDINNLKECLPYYQKFIRKLRYTYPEVRFITVPEFQKRGAVHYHVLCNIPYISTDALQHLWPYGFSKPKAVKSTTHLAIYLSKYLSKRFDDIRKQGHRLFYTSQGLRQPTIFYGLIAEEATVKLKDTQTFGVEYENQYKTERNGVVTYKQYLKKES